MSVGSLVLVFTSISDTVPLSLSVTKTVLPSGVTTDTLGFEPTVMSGSLVLVLTSITDTVPLPQFGTKAVARHGPRPATADAPTGNTPTNAPATPSTKTPRTHRIPASCPDVPERPTGRPEQRTCHCSPGVSGQRGQAEIADRVVVHFDPARITGYGPGRGAGGDVVTAPVRPENCGIRTVDLVARTQKH